MRLSSAFSIAFLVFASPWSSGAKGIAESTHGGEEIDQRSLQDVDTVVIGSDSSTITVTVDRTAANGLLTYGDKIVALTPFVSGSETRVTCTATMDSSIVNMQFFMRKAFRPDRDENGNAKDFDCQASSDNDLIAPDVETCEVTNFPNVGADAVFAYVAVLDDALALGATYTINFVCERIEAGGGGVCFSKDSTVDVLGKGATRMEELEIGDKVLVSENKYEPVYAFAHLDKTRSTKYLQIHTKSNDRTNDQPLEISESHLVLVDEKYVPAGKVQVGDVLQDAAGSAAEVIKITSTTKPGLYAPLTQSGSLVVNGITSSAYISLQQADTNVVLGNGQLDTGLSYHFVNHIALSPIRLTCMGISSSFCSNSNHKEHNGYAPFVSFWFDLVSMFQRQVAIVQVFLLMALFAVVGPLYIMELMAGPVLAPTLIAGRIMIALSRKTGKSQSQTDSDDSGVVSSTMKAY